MNYSDINANFTRVNQETEPEKWLELRTTGIGGSDAGALMGLNKYASPLTVFMQKNNVKGFEGNAATKWGHLLEDPIRQETTKEFDVKIEAVPGMYTSITNPFMNANIDSLIYLENNQVLIVNGIELSDPIIGHEIKTSSRGEGFTNEEIPDSYYCQVQHYMAVTGLDNFILTVFKLNTKEICHYVVPRNDDFISKLIEVEKDFWENYVLVNKIPEPIGVDSENDYIKNLHFDEVVILDEESESLISLQQDINKQIKDLEKQEDIVKNKILLKLSEASKGFDSTKCVATAGKYKLSYNQQIRKSLDSTAIKNDGLYDRYVKESVSRVLRISETK